MTRPRHQDKDLERVLRAAEKQGWEVTKGGGYFKLKCPCADKHLKTVKLTPSNPLYRRQLLNLLNRYTCWKEET